MTRSPSLPTLILVVAAVIGPLAILAVAATLTRQLVQEDAQRRVVRSTEVLRQHALRVFDTYQMILGQVERRAGDQPWSRLVGSRALHEDLRSLSEPVRSASSVFYLAPTGRHFASSQRFPMPEIDARDRDYFIDQSQRPSRLMIGAPAPAGRSGQPFFAVTRARLTPGGSFDGVFAVSADIADFRSFYQSLRESPLDVIGLMREDGVDLVRDPPRADAESARDGNASVMRAILESANRVFQASTEPEQVPRLYGYAKVGDYPLYVTYGLSMRAVDAQWRRSLALYSIVTLLVISTLLATLSLVRRNARLAMLAVAARDEQLELRKLAEEGLRRSQRLDAVGRMTGGIAHDFNNLLQVLVVNIEVLRRRMDERKDEPIGDIHERPLAAMERATQHGARLTRQLLSFSRRASLAPRRIRLTTFLSDMADLLRAVLRARIELTLDIDADTAPVDLDPDELELALLNLANNARDAMSEGGRLSLRAFNMPAGTVVDGEALQAPKVSLQITDTGSGMSAETMISIFDPFFTTKPIGKGTGLGLSQVYGFVTQSGGRVSVQSALDRGTCFTLLFPPAGSQIEDVDDVDEVDAQGPEALIGASVLVVDDEVDAGVAVSALIGEAGAIVHTARSAAEARGLLETIRFDLLLTDVRMPGTRGDLLAREALQRQPDIAVVLMTGYPEPIGDSGFDVLFKPVSTDDLLRAVRLALNRRRPTGAAIERPANPGAPRTP